MPPSDLENLRMAVRQGDDPRAALALADWLEEFGDEAARGRAEHIRLEWRTRHEPTMQGAEWVEGRLAHLREAHGNAWLGKVAGLRGVERWGIDCGLLWVWLRPAILKKDRLAVIAADGWLEGVRCEGWRNKDLRRLLIAPALARVPVLEILNAQGGPLALAQPLDALERLRLVNCRADDRSVAQIARTPFLPALRVLEMPFNRIGSSGAAALARTPLLARLKRLDLEANRIGPRGARALASSVHLGPLHLRLGFNRLGCRGAQHLAASPALAGLASLDLSWNGIGPEGGMALANAPALPSLRLEGNDLGAAHAALQERMKRVS